MLCMPMLRDEVPLRTFRICFDSSISVFPPDHRCRLQAPRRHLPVAGESALCGTSRVATCALELPTEHGRGFLQRNSRTCIHQGGAGRLECHHSCRASSLGPASCLCKTLSIQFIFWLPLARLHRLTITSPKRLDKDRQGTA